MEWTDGAATITLQFCQVTANGRHTPSHPISFLRKTCHRDRDAGAQGRSQPRVPPRVLVADSWRCHPPAELAV